VDEGELNVPSEERQLKQQEMVDLSLEYEKEKKDEMLQLW